MNQTEEKEFHKRFTELLSSTDPVTPVGLALIATAKATARSLKAVEKLPISATVGSDWVFNPTNGFLERIPARFERRWDSGKTKGSSVGWIHPLSRLWTVSLNPKLASALCEISKRHKKLKTLGDLWRQISPEASLTKWFSDAFQSVAELSRIPPSAIGRLVPMGTFEQTHNQSFAQLIGSRPRTGLPAACAYGAYRSRCNDFSR
jgi:hypothetical protein